MIVLAPILSFFSWVLREFRWGGEWANLLAIGVHTVGYLVVTGLVAWIVYEKLGLALLRKAWLNLDLIWAVALMATGCFVLLV